MNEKDFEWISNICHIYASLNSYVSILVSNFFIFHVSIFVSFAFIFPVSVFVSFVFISYVSLFSSYFCVSCPLLTTPFRCRHRQSEGISNITRLTSKMYSPIQTRYTIGRLVAWTQFLGMSVYMRVVSVCQFVSLILSLPVHQVKMTNRQRVDHLFCQQTFCRQINLVLLMLIHCNRTTAFGS